MIKFNGIEVAFSRFPNGETKMDETSLTLLAGMKQVVEFKYEDDSDLIKLMFLKKYLDTSKIEVDELVIYYMPYSRMDRSENNSPFTLKYVAEFINSLSFEQVTIIEPHSDVTNAVIDNVKPLYINYDLLPKVMEMTEFDQWVDYIVFPDDGASKRYKNMVDVCTLVGRKQRDFKTGRITSLELTGVNNGKGKKAIIVDDLSSYGGTFIMTAEELKQKFNVEEVYLLVAHAENSIFKGDLFNHVTKVFTTDSILTEQNHWDNKKYENQLHVFKIGEEL